MWSSSLSVSRQSRGTRWKGAALHCAIFSRRNQAPAFWRANLHAFCAKQMLSLFKTKLPWEVGERVLGWAKTGRFAVCFRCCWNMATCFLGKEDNERMGPMIHHIRFQPKLRGRKIKKPLAEFSVECRSMIEFAWLAGLWTLSSVYLEGTSHGTEACSGT